MKHSTKAKLTRKERIKRIAKWGTIGILTWETYLAVVVRRQRRRDAFNAALQRAHATGKQLIVIGNPDGPFLNRTLGRDYDCGDTCIDTKGCPKCPTVLTGQLDAILPTLPANNAVIFVSGQLERVANMEATLTELHRVSGGDLFVASMSPYSLFSLFGKRRILSAPPTTPFVRWRELPWRPGPSKVETHQLQGVSGVQAQFLSATWRH